MSNPFAWFKWQALFQDFGLFIQGFSHTLLIAILALVVSLILGILFGVLSSTKIKFFRMISRIYVEFYQNTPLLIQVFFLYNGLPFAGIYLNVMVIGIFGVGIYHGAYMSEVIRAGIESISKGQLEAALSQGFTYTQAMRYIIIPQARKVILPPLTNQVVNLIKNTSILAMIAGGELMYHADSWANQNLYYGPAYITAGVLYFIICYPLTALAKRMEQRGENLWIASENEITDDPKKVAEKEAVYNG